MAANAKMLLDKLLNNLFVFMFFILNNVFWVLLFFDERQ